MHITQRKEQFSIAYVRAVAAAAGYAVYKMDVDDDSIDLGLSGITEHGTRRGPRLEMQLKCSASVSLTDVLIPFALPVKNYNELRPVDVLVPRILVLVHVPENVSEWVAQSPTELSMRHCGYWYSLRGLPETDNIETVTVRIPQSHVFTPTALTAIMNLVETGGAP